MSRVSQLELYNDKDVITQILLMKEQVETGTYKKVRIIETGGNYVFEFVNQKDEVETFTVPAKQISGVTSSQAGSTVTMRITYNDRTYQDVSWTAGGDVTTNTAQNITAVKTFTVSPIVPDTPSGTHASVNVTYVSKTDGTNNLLHTSANEVAAGVKEGIWRGYYLGTPAATTVGKWLRFASFNNTHGDTTIVEVIGTLPNNGVGYAKAIVSGNAGYIRMASIANVPVTQTDKVIAALNNTQNTTEIWIYVSQVATANSLKIYTSRKPNTVTIHNEEYDNPLDSSIGDTISQ